MYKLLLLLLFPWSWLTAQNDNYTAMNLPFSANGSTLPFALTGGLEAPQFAHFDLNQDEHIDLLVFDRVGSKILPFLAVVQSEGLLTYEYTPDYEHFFPKMYQLMMIRDMNCDGLDDIVTTRTFSISASEVVLIVYFQEEGLVFGEYVDFQLPDNDQDSLIRIHAFDTPSLEDINGDGFEDLLYIPIGGTKILYYKRIPSGNNGCQGLEFAIANDCWGNASYTINADFLLQECGPAPPPGILPENGCAGSVMLAQDYDQDGDKDLYFSGLYDYEILQLNNGGDVFDADLISQSISWLNEGQPLLTFPSPFFLDLYGDGQEDLIVATNGIGGLGNSPDSHILYHFVDDPETNNWAMQADDFWIKDMIDLGFRSSPTVWDVNEDGLADILLAYNTPDLTYAYTSRIALFLNTGSLEAPQFELTTDDFAGLSVFNYKAIHPTLGDLNQDGKAELIIGLGNGRIEVFSKNGDGMEDYTLMPDHPFTNFILNGYAKPQLVDLDQDGLVDLVAGTRNGTISYLENTGTANAPVFSVITDTLSGIAPNAYFQENSIHFETNQEGGFDLYYGHRDGTISLYKGGLENGFDIYAQRLENIDVGDRASICLYDLNGDGQLEIISGNTRGGLEIFTPVSPSSTNSHIPSLVDVNIFPNPLAGNLLNLETVDREDSIQEVSIVNATGQLIYHKVATTPIHHISISTVHFEKGVFFYYIKTKKGETRGKFIKL
ncbi:MAG: FG-GAP-like repeat-containing protein [Chitinophagales bacterium]|nr:FG-GAP-like repeat-containing protein [Chitinophagales bacterium]